MTHSPATAMDALHQVNMPVRDVERAVAFYRDTLGLTLHARRGNLAFFASGGLRILVEQTDEEGGRYAHPGSVLYFRVPDVEAAYRDLGGRGVEFVEPPAVVSRGPM